MLYPLANADGAMQDVLQCHLMIGDVLGDRTQALDLFGRLVPGSRDEPVLRRPPGRDWSGLRRYRNGCRPARWSGVANRSWNCTIWVFAVTQSTDEYLKVLDDVDDIAAAVGQRG